MTFENSAWAINGAQLTSALARRAEYAVGGREEGVVRSADLKVTELSVPGIGVKIAPGVALILNKYQTDPNEAYVVSNPGVHTIPSGEMPASNASARSYILAIVIGDPDFNQTGHPWMGVSDPPAGEELTFEYVRPTLVQVSAGATTISGAQYPFYPLARIDIPANTTTILNSMIHDLRELTLPRQSQNIYVSSSTAWAGANEKLIAAWSSYLDWGQAQFSPSVPVPEWATTCIVVASINGVRLTDTTVNVVGGVRAQFGSTEAGATAFDMPISVGAIRANFQCAGSFAVPSSMRGTSQALRIEGFESIPATPTDNQRLKLTSGSQVIFDVRFFEDKE